MTNTKGLNIKETDNGLYLTIKRDRCLYGQAYFTNDKKLATRLFLELVDTYRTKGVRAVMGGY
jgi:hypothetical protein